MPFPGCGYYFFKIPISRLPPHFLHRLFAGADQYSGVTRPPFHDLRRDLFSGYPAGRIDYLFYWIAVPVSQVVLSLTRAIQQSLQGKEMCLCKVIDMDVIPDAGPVFRGVIISININFTPLSQGRLKDQRNQVSLRVMILSDFTIRISARCIEISQWYGINTISVTVVIKDLLYH